MPKRSAEEMLFAEEIEFSSTHEAKSTQPNSSSTSNLSAALAMQSLTNDPESSPIASRAFGRIFNSPFTTLRPPSKRRAHSRSPKRAWGSYSPRAFGSPDRPTRSPTRLTCSRTRLTRSPIRLSPTCTRSHTRPSHSATRPSCHFLHSVNSRTSLSPMANFSNHRSPTRAAHDSVGTPHVYSKKRTPLSSDKCVSKSKRVPYATPNSFSPGMLAKASADIQHLKRQVAAVRSEIALQEQHNYRIGQGENEQLLQKHSELRHEVSSAKQHAEEQARKTSELSECISNVRQASAELQLEIRLAQTTQQEALERRAKLEQAIDQKLLLLERAKSENADFDNAELEAVKSAISGNDVSKLETELAAITANQQRLQAQLRTSQKESEQSEIRCAQLRREIAETAECQSACLQKVSARTDELKIAKQQLSEHEACAAQAQKILVRVKDEVLSWHTTHETELESVNQECSSALAALCEQRDRRLRDQEEQLDRLIERKRCSLTEHEGLVQEVQAARQRIVKAKNEMRTEEANSGPRLAELKVRKSEITVAFESLEKTAGKEVPASSRSLALEKTDFESICKERTAVATSLNQKVETRGKLQAKLHSVQKEVKCLAVGIEQKTKSLESRQSQFDAEIDNLCRKLSHVDRQCRQLASDLHRVVHKKLELLQEANSEAACEVQRKCREIRGLIDGERARSRKLQDEVEKLEFFNR